MAAHKSSSLIKYWTPRYWPVWFLFGCLRISLILPVRWQINISKRVGRLLGWLLPERRHIAERNLAVCFPKLSTEERGALVKEHPYLCLKLSQDVLALQSVLYFERPVLNRTSP